MNRNLILFTAIFGAGMANLGLSNNLMYTFTCPQYYLDYFIFFGFGLFLWKMANRLKTVQHYLTQSTLFILLVLIICTYIFDASYAYVTGCNFNSVFFYSSKAPMVGAYAASILFLIPVPVTGCTMEHWIKTVDGTTAKVLEKDITYITLKNQIVRIHKIDNTILLTSKTIKSLASELNAKTFFQANRTTLINRDSVREVISNNGKGLIIKLADETVTTINKNRTVEFKKWFDFDSV